MKQSKTLITIPVYNEGKFISRTIKSCLSQTVKTQILIVDNCSTDNTIEIIDKFRKKHSHIKLIKNSHNLGRIGNWNRCLELFEESEYQYIKYVFAGDELYPECIEEVEKAFAIDTNIGAVVFPYLFVKLNGEAYRDTALWGNKLYDLKEINWANLYDGGILGAIVCNAYNKKFIQGYRFSSFFIGKSDFDFEILSRSKAYFLDKTLAKFYVEAHDTFDKAQDYIIEIECAFNRTYHLEKNRRMFNKSEHERIKEKILFDLLMNNISYVRFWAYLKLTLRLYIKLFIVKSALLKKRLGSYF
jgi:glycosyltransferase involved in cell wall biosynthesis